MRRRQLLRALAAPTLAAAAGCRRDQGQEARPPGKLRLVLKHQPLWGDPGPFEALLASFQQNHPDVELVTEPLPNASDIVHQFFLTALEGGARDFDVFLVDVVWVPEFARAGWIADLSDALSPATLREQFLPGAADAVIVEGRTYAVPWYVDVGVLHYRTDLVAQAPATYADLVQAALDLKRSGATRHGYVWQARQYEGLVCNVYEAVWGHGGATLDERGRVLVDSPEARRALGYLRALLERGVSPRSVTSQAEEESRRVFQAGDAAFLRNWPYAHAEAQREGSPIRGKVAMAPLPTDSGEPGSGTLGGYQLALNAHTPAYKREAAVALVAHLTSFEANVTLALAYGRNPPRRAPYEDARLVAGAPLIAALLPMIERAKPRPVTPYYPMISDTLQGEFSAVIAGIRSPDVALGRAQRLVDHLMGVDR